MLMDRGGGLVFSTAKYDHLFLIHFWNIILEVAFSQMDRRRSTQSRQVTLQDVDHVQQH